MIMMAVASRNPDNCWRACRRVRTAPDAHVPDRELLQFIGLISHPDRGLLTRAVQLGEVDRVALVSFDPIAWLRRINDEAITGHSSRSRSDGVGCNNRTVRPRSKTAARCSYPAACTEFDGLGSFRAREQRWPASSRQRFGSAKWILCRFILCRCRGVTEARKPASGKAACSTNRPQLCRIRIIPAFELPRRDWISECQCSPDLSRSFEMK